jgi:DNA polymerase-3 subunit beta
MELVVPKTEIARELQLLQGIVERKTTIPVLANIRLEAREDQLHFLATDLEVALRTRCPASVSRAGALTVQAKKLYEIIRALPDCEVRIAEERSSNVKVAADTFTSRLQTMSLDDYPTLPDEVPEPSMRLPGALIRQMIEKIQFAMTLEDTRYYLNGALLLLRSDSIGLVATDGHRLALATARHQPVPPVDQDQRIILPRKTVAELARLLADAGDSDFSYSRTDNHLFFKVDNRLLLSRAVDGQFPAYEKVIPKAADKRAEFDRDRFTAALRRVALLSNERSKAVKIEFESGKVELSANNGDLGEARETLAVAYDGSPVRTSFNAQYLLDFLAVVGTEAVAMELKDEVSQAVMKPVAFDRFDYTYVLMPMRI